MSFLQCNRENKGGEDRVILLDYGVHLQQCVTPCWTNCVVDDGGEWGIEGDIYIFGGKGGTQQQRIRGGGSSGGTSGSG